MARRVRMNPMMATMLTRAMRSRKKRSARSRAKRNHSRNYRGMLPSQSPRGSKRM